jgi:hypothetical protein
LRREVTGSAHSECGLLDNVHIEKRLRISMNPNSFYIRRTGEKEDLIIFNQHGINKGWCAWPINFDPVWVKCEIPFEMMEKQDS